MASESILSSLAKGSTAAQDALAAYREGVEFSQKQAALGQKSKLGDIAVAQGLEELKAQQITTQAKQAELEQFKKQSPLMDRQMQLSLDKLSAEQELLPLNTQFAFATIQNQLNTLPIEQRAQSLTSMTQVLTSLTPDNYGEFVSRPEVTKVVQAYRLTGNYNNDKPMLDAIAAAAQATPALMAAKWNKEATIEAGREAAKARAATQVQVAELRGPATARIRAQNALDVQAMKNDGAFRKAQLIASAKTPPKISSGEVKDAAVMLKSTGIFEDLDDTQLTGMGQIFMTQVKAFQQAGLDLGEASDRAFKVVSSAYEKAVDPTPSVTKSINKFLGAPTGTAPSPAQVQAEAVRTEAAALRGTKGESPPPTIVEGTVRSSKSGKPIIFKNGRWEYM